MPKGTNEDNVRLKERAILDYPPSYTAIFGELE